MFMHAGKFLHKALVARLLTVTNDTSYVWPQEGQLGFQHVKMPSQIEQYRGMQC